MPKQQGEQLQQSSTYTFKYQTDSESIDANTMLISQMHFATILNEVKQEIAPDAALKIRIKPLAKGSVPFEFLLDVSWLSHLFSHENLTVARDIIATLTGLIKLRKELKGKKPETVEVIDNKVIVKQGDVTLEIDKRTYEINETNSTIDTAFKKSFEVIEKDEEIIGVQLEDENKQPIAEVTREDFSSVAATNNSFNQLTEKSELEAVELVIFKVVFEPGFKWQFYYNSRKINAYIKDDGFMERVNRGEPFAKGDVLIVNMEVEKILDNDLQIFVERDFIITKVLNHTPKQPPRQQFLFGEDR